MDRSYCNSIGCPKIVFCRNYGFEPESDRCNPPKKKHRPITSLRGKRKK